MRLVEGTDLGQSDRLRRPPADTALGRRHHRAGCRCADLGARGRPGAPRRHAVECAHQRPRRRRGRLRISRRLRDRARPAGIRGHCGDDEHRDRRDSLGYMAPERISGGGRRLPIGHLLADLRVLRVPDRPHAVPGRVVPGDVRARQRPSTATVGSPARAAPGDRRRRGPGGDSPSPSPNSAASVPNLVGGSDGDTSASLMHAYCALHGSDGTPGMVDRVGCTAIANSPVTYSVARFGSASALSTYLDQLTSAKGYRFLGPTEDQQRSPRPAVQLAGHRQLRRRDEFDLGNADLHRPVLRRPGLVLDGRRRRGRLLGKSAFPGFCSGAVPIAATRIAPPACTGVRLGFA